MKSLAAVVLAIGATLVAIPHAIAGPGTDGRMGGGSWQPSEDSDRLSTIELEAKYPRPELIPIAGALVGKTFCTYCGGPFPAELVSCPHCGAPAREAA